jgi:chemotaxis protein methyltransferase WspC
MSLSTIESLLEQRIGLSVDTIGVDTIASVIRRRMAQCQLPNYAAYLEYLTRTDAEWEELIEAVVVPETWFFRNEESFMFLKQFLKLEWLPKQPHSPLRALSIPCSTGEEPYSIAMTFLEAGVPQEQFHIDAVDISNRALHKARHGCYGPESFRQQDMLSLRDRYFSNKPEGFQIHATLQNAVQFIHDNVLNVNILRDAAPYDFVFCRNLLIYLSPGARQQVSQVIDRLLAKTGILFIGHAERPLFQMQDFASITTPGVFAYYRNGRLNDCKIFQKQHSASRFQRRKLPRFEKQPPTAQSRSHQQPSRSSSQTSLPKRVFHKNSKIKHRSVPELDGRRVPRNTVAHMLDAAREFADQGELQQALHLCKEVVQKNAAHVQAHFLMGLIYQALRDEAQAEKSFYKTMYLDPNHHDALYYLALIMEERGQQQQARQLRQRIQRIYQRTQQNEN